jgi:hypothetical protein
VKAVRRNPSPSVKPVVAPEHEFEAEFGLPEPLPAAERVLWQGQPQVGAIMRRVFHLPLVAGYFALLVGWSVLSAWSDGASATAILRGLLTPVLLSAVGLGMLGTLAWLTARTAVYTLTDRRVVMRIGIVLTVTYNFPLRCIDGAHVHPTGQGTGEIALQLQRGTRIAWLHLWPHARPWHLREPQPLLRGLTDVGAVSALLSQAWSNVNGVAARPVAASTPSAVAGSAGALASSQPAAGGAD